MIRPFAPMAKADIVIASPLSLRLFVGAAGDKKRNYDFLSSIEVFMSNRHDRHKYDQRPSRTDNRDEEESDQRRACPGQAQG